jgi:hypothetical protein
MKSNRYNTFITFALIITDERDKEKYLAAYADDNQPDNVDRTNSAMAEISMERGKRGIEKGSER